MRLIYGTYHLVKVVFFFFKCLYSVSFFTEKIINWYLTIYSKKQLKNMTFSLSILLSCCCTVQISEQS